MQAIGDRIRLLRKEKRWTKKKLAEEIDCHRNLIGVWESNKCIPSALMIIELSNVFGVTTDYILKGGNR